MSKETNKQVDEIANLNEASIRFSEMLISKNGNQSKESLQKEMTRSIADKLKADIQQKFHF
jgi:hypothetical protein